MANLVAQYDADKAKYDKFEAERQKADRDSQYREFKKAAGDRDSFKKAKDAAQRGFKQVQEKVTKYGKEISEYQDRLTKLRSSLQYLKDSADLAS